MFKESEQKEINQKKEWTKGIITDLKGKIDEFKNIKKQEKHFRKDELNFDINHDLINQFKKTKPEIQIDNNITESNLPLSIMLDKSKEPKNNLLDISTHSQKLLIQNKRNDKHINNINYNNNLSNNLRTQNYGIGRNSNQSLYAKDNSMEKIRKTNFDEKKEEIINYLNVKEKKQKFFEKKKTPSISLNFNQTPPFSQSQANLYTTKDKVKNFFEKTENKNPNQILKTPTYDYSSKASARKSDICMTTGYYNQKNKNVNSIEAFGDFNLKPQEKKNKRTLSSDPFNFGKIHDINNQEFCLTPHNKTKTEFMITASSIRAIANKLSFCSNDDIMKMDKGLTTELINLSNLISRTFASSSKKT